MGRETKRPKFDADAFGRGYDAYCNGLGINDNPFDANTAPTAYRCWEDAWREGRAGDQDELENLRLTLAGAGKKGMTQADIVSKIDYLEGHRFTCLLRTLIRSGEISVSEASDGTTVYRTWPVSEEGGV